MSASTAQARAPAAGIGGERAEAAARVLAGGRFYVLLAAAALVIAALSLLFPSTPSYDPWAWIVWGREILHGSLHTPGGPTWKPLPVIFTTAFSPLGSAAPDLWLVIARAGAIVASVMTFKLAARLTWWLGEPTSRDATYAAPGLAARLAAAAPAVLAGAIAIVGLVLSGGFLSSSALGYSEGLMVACVLIALERHVDGHPRQAFVLGFLAALDRPEIWLFWGPYGLWLMWRDPGSRPLVVSLAVATLALWFVPQKLGSGSWFSGVTRANHPRSNSAAFAHCPFCAELTLHAWPQVLLRLKVAAAAAVVTAAGALWRTWGGRPGWRLASRRERAMVLLVVIGGFGLVWWVLVAIETQMGFSGNDRYLVLGSACIEIAGGVGFGWAAIELARYVKRRVPALRARLAIWKATAIATAASSLVFLFVPGWVGNSLIDLPEVHGSLLYQAHLREDLAALIARDGGAKRMLACGTVMTEGFQVPMVAWYLNVRTIKVLDQPATNPAGLAVTRPGGPLDTNWPNTILQDRDNRSAALLPLPQTIIGWEHEGAHYRYIYTRTFKFFQACRGGA